MGRTLTKFNLPLFLKQQWLKFELLNIKKSYPNIDKSVRIGFNPHIYGEGNIFIGKDTHIGNDCILETDKDTYIKIGKKVMISHNVAIYTSNPISNQLFSNKNLKFRKGNVIINDFTWICKNVFIREGVEIGLNSVIGANSVVLNNIPDFSVAVGNPVIVKKHILGEKIAIC